MSVTVWARRLACDWTGCEGVSDIETEPPLSMAEAPAPADWTCFEQARVIRSDGRWIAHLCSLHSRATAADLAAMLKGSGNGIDG